MTAHVLGIDMGGSGARACLARMQSDGSITSVWSAVTEVPGRTDGTGVNTEQFHRRLAALLTDLPSGGDGDVVAAAVGATGLVHQGHHLYERIPEWIAQASGARAVVVCSDMLTSYVAGLGWRAGAIVAAGTGAVAVGSDMAGHWRRVDGWGYNLGDAGGGAWIGRHGLDAGLRAHDGRSGGSPVLRDRLLERFGDPVGLAGEIARRDDRAAVMAAFAPAVLAAVGQCPIARKIVDRAGRHLAESAVAALLPGGRLVAPVGGLFADTGLLDGFTRALHQAAEEVELCRPAAAGDVGAASLAARVWQDRALPAGTELLGARLSWVRTEV
jgi:N-acetylglucosamine kinase-like BadF-type ATPase